jgi:hypothetical protein
MYRAAAAASSLACIFFIHKLLHSIALAPEYPVIVKDNFQRAALIPLGTSCRKSISS